MCIRALIVFALLPTASLAEERIFNCGAPDAAHPEMAATLVKYEGQDKGHITIDDVDIDVAVYPGLDTLTFLYIGDGYTLNYNVHPEKGTFDYVASGSKAGWGRGACAEVVE